MKYKIVFKDINFPSITITCNDFIEDQTSYVFRGPLMTVPIGNVLYIQEIEY